MKITVISANALTAAHVRDWIAMLREDPTLDSPFFRPEFTQAVARVRDDTEVAVLENDGQVVGFLPFQRAGAGIGKPIGNPMNDFHGAIVRSSVSWTPEQVIASAGLRAWRFDHLPVTQSAFHHCVVVESPIIDLSAGFEAYVKNRRRMGCELIPRAFRKLARAERESGPMRFVPHTADQSVLETLFDWKSEQCQRTGVPNLFSLAWPRQLLHRILQANDPAFSGMLSALYLGDRLAAIHFGLRSFGVLHSWFPTFNRALASYSPGIGLFGLMLKAAPALGIQRVDLGKGTPRFKRNLASSNNFVAEGCVDERRLNSSLWHTWLGAKDLVRNSPFHQSALRLKRVVCNTRVALGYID